MANEKHLNIFRKGKNVWNEWRNNNPNIIPDFRKYNFYDDQIKYNSIYGQPYLEGYNFDGVDFFETSMRDGDYINCSFNGSKMNYVDACFANFFDCKFNDASIRVSKIGSASFIDCEFFKTNLSYCSAEETSFNNCYIESTNLSNISFIKTNFSNSTLKKCSVYGISSWDLTLDNTKQEDLIITDSIDDVVPITVDNIEVAQFLYLIINNVKLRNIIDAMTTKIVLILGRFTDDRLKILRIIKNKIRENDMIPILFDFNGPTNKDINETIQLLANISKFVIADITNPRSIPQELITIVPNSPSTIIQPIILKGGSEYGMFEHFTRYPWVKEKIIYSDETIYNCIQEIIDKLK